MRAMGIIPPQQKKKTVAKKAINPKEADDYIAKMRVMGIMVDPKDGSEDTESDVDE